MSEKLKSIVLFILLLMALVLTYLNTAGSFFVVRETVSGVPDDVEELLVIQPRAISCSLGNGLYTRIYSNELFDEVWAEFFEPLSSLDITEQVREPISKTAFFEQFSNPAFLFQMTTIRLGGEPESALADIFSYDDVMVTESAVFLRRGERFFKVPTVVSSYAKARDLVAKSDHISYRRVSERFSLLNILGEEEKYLNYCLIPYFYNASVTKTSAMYEYSVTNRRDINDMAKGVFGKRLDFTQSFLDSSGSVVLMSDRGKQSLSFTQNGMVIYREKFSEKASEPTDFKHALQKAIGGIRLVGGLPDGLFLKDCVKRNGAYDFSFGYTFGGGHYPVIGKDVGISVLVQGDQVIEIKRRVLVPKLVRVPESPSLYSIDQCIIDNVRFFTVDFKEHSSNKVFYIYSLIEEASMVFSYDEQDLSPTWRIIVNGKAYFFDAVDGHYLGDMDGLEKN